VVKKTNTYQYEIEKKNFGLSSVTRAPIFKKGRNVWRGKPQEEGYQKMTVVESENNKQNRSEKQSCCKGSTLVSGEEGPIPSKKKG